MNATRGLLMTLITVQMWALLPLAMKQVLQTLDPQTILACRFIIAAAVAAIFLHRKAHLPRWQAVRRNPLWFAVGIAGLAGNFWLFSKALIYLEPAAAQVLAQLSPFILLFAGVIFLREKMERHQWLGTALLLAGIALFFNRQWAALGSAQWLGIVLNIGGSVVWVAYALAQKALLKHFSAQQILFVLYAGCMILTLPLATWASLGGLNAWQWTCLAFCCANTPIAYGAFAEALSCWDVGKVSAIMTLVPLFTIAYAEIAFLLAPANFAEPSLNLPGYLGAGIVVCGALCSVRGKTRR